MHDCVRYGPWVCNKLFLLLDWCFWWALISILCLVIHMFYVYVCLKYAICFFSGFFGTWSGLFRGRQVGNPGGGVPDRNSEHRRSTCFEQCRNSQCKSYSLKKSETQTKKCSSLQTRRLAKSFQGLNSSIAVSVPEVFPHKDMWKLLVLALKQAGHEGVRLRFHLHSKGLFKSSVRGAWVHCTVAFGFCWYVSAQVCQKMFCFLIETWKCLNKLKMIIWFRQTMFSFVWITAWFINLIFALKNMFLLSTLIRHCVPAANLPAMTLFCPIHGKKSWSQDHFTDKRKQITVRLIWTTSVTKKNDLPWTKFMSINSRCLSLSLGLSSKENEVYENFLGNKEKQKHISSIPVKVRITLLTVLSESKNLKPASCITQTHQHVFYMLHIIVDMIREAIKL